MKKKKKVFNNKILNLSH